MTRSPIDLVDDNRWRRRAARARALAHERPTVADTLRFYATVAEAQETLLRERPEAISAQPIGPMAFVDRLNRRDVFSVLPKLLAALQLPAMCEHEISGWREALETYWTTAGRQAGADNTRRFAIEALVQPFAEAVASALGTLGTLGTPGTACPLCTGGPVVAVLREQGHGARRSLVCGLCLTEWPALRLVCLGCGEERFQSLPVFRAEEFDAVRLDACESCGTYVKTIDLTRDATAIPLVDDVASLPLDIWARESGYSRARPNLFGF